MSWTPAYQAGFTEQLIDQLLAVIQRDQRAALDFVQGGVLPVLPSIASYQTSPTATQQYPVALLAPIEDVFDAEAQAGSLHYSSFLRCEIAVSNQDSRIMARLLQRYIRALDAVFHSLADSNGSLGFAASFYTSLPLDLPELGGTVNTTPLAAGTVKELWVGRHELSEIQRLPAGGFWKAGVIELRVDREET